MRSLVSKAPPIDCIDSLQDAPERVILGHGLARGAAQLENLVRISGKIAKRGMNRFQARIHEDPSFPVYNRVCVARPDSDYRAAGCHCFEKSIRKALRS